MKKLLALLAVPALASADGYQKKIEGVEPYSTHYSGAEIFCLAEGFSWPGLLTGEKAAQLQTSEMVLCIEQEINNRVAIAKIEEDGHAHRLLEIEEALQKLMLEREALINGG